MLPKSIAAILLFMCKNNIHILPGHEIIIYLIQWVNVSSSQIHITNTDKQLWSFYLQISFPTHGYWIFIIKQMQTNVWHFKIHIHFIYILYCSTVNNFKCLIILKIQNIPTGKLTHLWLYTVQKIYKCVAKSKRNLQ